VEHFHRYSQIWTCIERILYLYTQQASMCQDTVDLEFGNKSDCGRSRCLCHKLLQYLILERWWLQNCSNLIVSNNDWGSHGAYDIEYKDYMDIAFSPDEERVVFSYKSLVTICNNLMHRRSTSYSTSSRERMSGLGRSTSKHATIRTASLASAGPRRFRTLVFVRL